MRRLEVSLSFYDVGPIHQSIRNEPPFLEALASDFGSSSRRPPKHLLTLRAATDSSMGRGEKFRVQGWLVSAARTVLRQWPWASADSGAFRGFPGTALTSKWCRYASVRLFAAHTSAAESHSPRQWASDSTVKVTDSRVIVTAFPTRFFFSASVSRQ